VQGFTPLTYIYVSKLQRSVPLPVKPLIIAYLAYSISFDPQLTHPDDKFFLLRLKEQIDEEEKREAEAREREAEMRKS